MLRWLYSVHKSLGLAWYVNCHMDSLSFKTDESRRVYLTATWILHYFLLYIHNSSLNIFLFFNCSNCQINGNIPVSVLCCLSPRPLYPWCEVVYTSQILNVFGFYLSNWRNIFNVPRSHTWWQEEKEEKTNGMVSTTKTEGERDARKRPTTTATTTKRIASMSFLSRWKVC